MKRPLRAAARKARLPIKEQVGGGSVSRPQSKVRRKKLVRTSGRPAKSRAEMVPKERFHIVNERRRVRLGNNTNAPLMIVAEKITLMFGRAPVSIVLSDSKTGTLLTDEQFQLYMKHAFTECGGSAGVALIHWPASDAYLLDMSTAHGDGDYAVLYDGAPSGEVSVDAGAISVIERDAERRLLAAAAAGRHAKEDAGFSALFEIVLPGFSGSVEATHSGLLTGSRGLRIDTS